MDLKETYNKIAADWHSDHLKDDWYFGGTTKYLSFLSPGDLILDIGCAGGAKTNDLVKEGFKVVGIDISEKMIEIAKKEVPTGKFYVLDLDSVDKLEDEFDGIVMRAVLLHVPKKEVAEKIKKIVSKLKVGGYLYIAVKGTWPNGPEEEIKTENDYGYDYQRFFSYFTTDEIETHLRNLGLEIIYSDLTKSGHTDWIQVVGKKL